MSNTEEYGRVININGHLWREYLYKGTSSCVTYKLRDIILSNGNIPISDTSDSEENK